MSSIELKWVKMVHALKLKLKNKIKKVIYKKKKKKKKKKKNPL